MRVILEVIRPMAEYLLSDKCENSNYGSKFAGDMVDYIAKSCSSGVNALFNKGRLITDPMVYIIQSNYSLNFGTGSNPTPFTIAMFFYLPTASVGGPYLQFGTQVMTGKWPNWATCKLKYTFYYYNNQIRFSYCTPALTPSEITTSVSLQTPNWFHFAVTYDGATLKFFINGVFHAAYGNTLSTANVNLYGLLFLYHFLIQKRSDQFDLIN